tara:strand:+ start:364 stop:1230 length:867 start_codon:yes stop_codon:yes gene_type:complete
MLCKGSWKETAQNIVYNENIVECELRSINGNWIYNKLKFFPEYEYHNINGRFQWIFDNSILFLIMNMKKNSERWSIMEKNFENINKKYNCKYLKIDAIYGKQIENDVSAQEILKPRKKLLGKTFHCYESNEEWVYDGTISKSFPGLHLNGHHGTKGLTLSNIKCLNIIKEQYPNYNWYCILEDDSHIDENIYNKIIEYIKNTNYLNDITLLDIRRRGGACALLYNQRIINDMIENLHPLSNLSIKNEEIYKKETNLWDYKLWVYLDNFNIKNVEYPIVSSGSFISEIS